MNNYLESIGVSVCDVQFFTSFQRTARDLHGHFAITIWFARVRVSDTARFHLDCCIRSKGVNTRLICNKCKMKLTNDTTTVAQLTSPIRVPPTVVGDDEINMIENVVRVSFSILLRNESAGLLRLFVLVDVAAHGESGVAVLLILFGQETPRHGHVIWRRRKWSIFSNAN